MLTDFLMLVFLISTVNNIKQKYSYVVSEEKYTEEGIPSPLAPSLLVAFYDTQRIRWRYSLLYA